MLRSLLCTLLILGCAQAQAGCSSCKEKQANKYIQERLTKEDKRYGTFAYILELMEQRGAKTIVETGTSRYGAGNCAGDGCSTLIFVEYIKKNGGDLFSVDIDPLAIECARYALNVDNQYVSLVTSDSIPFLKSFGQQIDFLYLDSFDYDYGNPTPSQEHHLKEIEAAYQWLTKDSIVMIDDHDLPNGGKSKLVIEYLLDRGWTIVAESYQVILVQRPRQ